MDKMDILQTTTLTHVHEFEGYTEFAEGNDELHNHRFAGVTNQVIPKGDSHIHGLFVDIDFLSHHHKVIALTGPPIYLWGKGDTHVHFVKSVTTMDDCHFHKFQFASLFLSPFVG